MTDLAKMNDEEFSEFAVELGYRLSSYRATDIAEGKRLGAIEEIKAVFDVWDANPDAKIGKYLARRLAELTGYTP